MTKTRYTQADMDAVTDNPELTEADIAAARPFTEVFPELAASMRGKRGAQKTPTKVSTTIRLSPDVIAYFKQNGAGWQARIDAALKEWVASH
ncbi:MAG: BrnA antitoxin family protein [Sphingomonadales bacterium]|nr:BrnA antitoxin family protein [Sphingomonadales bacterium]MDE2170316.1 BrnA antitoxin family protein [Sphingomonadales bacterium]